MTKVDYPVGDFLIRVKNVALAGHSEVITDNTKLVHSTALALKDMGYLKEVKVTEGKLNVTITKVSKKPLVTDIKLISKPGLRIYMGADEIEKRRSPSQLIVSTSKGVVSAKIAIKNKMGGEIIAEVL